MKSLVNALGRIKIVYLYIEILTNWNLKKIFNSNFKNIFCTPSYICKALEDFIEKIVKKIDIREPGKSSILKEQMDTITTTFNTHCL